MPVVLSPDSLLPGIALWAPRACRWLPLRRAGGVARGLLWACIRTHRLALPGARSHWGWNSSEILRESLGVVHPSSPRISV